MKKLYAVGIGPGDVSHLTKKAKEAIFESEVICGYPKYLKNIESLLEGKEIYESKMTKEVERCKNAIEFAESGKTTSIVSSGDSGIYGMAGLVLELSKNSDIEIEVVPGITSAISAAAELGAPLMHDFCLISLSDILTPKKKIEERLKAAGSSDFVIALYNPKSKHRPDALNEAMEILKNYKKENTPVGIVRHSGTKKAEISTMLLKDFTDENCDMHTVIIVGNEDTVLERGKMITPRGYKK